RPWTLPRRRAARLHRYANFGYLLARGAGGRPDRPPRHPHHERGGSGRRSLPEASHEIERRCGATTGRPRRVRPGTPCASIALLGHAFYAVRPGRGWHRPCSPVNADQREIKGLEEKVTGDEIWLAHPMSQSPALGA